MASAELAQFPLRAEAPAPRLALLARLADFQRELNEEFDDCRHGERNRPGQALQRLRAGIELLCRLQEELLHPALSASRPEPWPALGQAMESVDALRDLAGMGERIADRRQRALVALLEGLVQLHFASLDDLLDAADPAAMPWQALEAAAEAALRPWRAGGADAEDRYAVG